MNTKAEPQYVVIDQPFGQEPPNIHCPVCGRAVFDPDEESGDVTPCPHLAFVYLGGAGDFVYASDEFAKRANYDEDEEFEFEDFPELLKKADYGNELLAIEVNYGGIACGPVWFTDIYGFDFSKSWGKGQPNVP